MSIFLILKRTVLANTKLITNFIKKTNLLFLLIVITIFLTSITKINASSKIIAGYYENIHIKELNLKYTALLDTGASFCALHAYGIKAKRKRNGLYVRFYTSNKKGKRTSVIKKVANILNIRSSNGIVERRYAVYLRIKLGKITKRVIVTLTNRITQKARILIGRNYLKNKFLIDSGRVFIIN